MRARIILGGAVLIVVAAAVTALLLLSSGGTQGGRQSRVTVLVRPQTAADRAAFARARRGLLRGLETRAARASVRLARTTPWGQPVFVLSERHGRAKDFTVAWGGAIVGGPMASAPGWTLEQSSGGAYYAPAGTRAPAAVTRIVVLVPDDVARVRFAYPDGGPARTVPVIANVAAAEFLRPCCVLEPEMTWYASNGATVRHQLVRPDSHFHMAPPPRS